MSAEKIRSLLWCIALFVSAVAASYGSVVANSSTVVYPFGPFTPVNESVFYHGSPTVLSIPSAELLIGAFEGSPTSVTEGMNNQAIYLVRSTNGGSTWSYPQLLTSNVGVSGAMWSPALFYDEATRRVYIYYSVDTLLRGGRLFVSFSTDFGQTWTYQEPVIGVEGFITGRIQALSTTFNGSPTWAFLVENTGVGTLIVQALQDSTTYQISPVRLSSNYTQAKLVRVNASAFAMIAATNAFDVRNSSASNSMPLVATMSQDATLMDGWAPVAETGIVNRFGSDFYAASMYVVGNPAGQVSFVAVANFVLDPSGTNISNVEIQGLTFDPSVVRSVTGASSGTQNSVIAVAGDVGVLEFAANPAAAGDLPSDLTLSPILSTAADNASGTISNFVVTIRLGNAISSAVVELHFNSTKAQPSQGTSPSEPSSKTAIAITFIVVGTIATLLILVYVQGRLRQKRMSEEHQLLRPDDSAAAVGYSGNHA